jgi:predicted  nucleic acid-binding Zn-ribbon protein
MADSIELVATRLDSLHRDVGEIKQSVDKLSDAVVKLALVEERVATSQATLQRAFNAIEKNAAAIEKLSQRMSNIEKTQPQTTLMAQRIENALWAAAAVVCIVLLKKTGVL